MTKTFELVHKIFICIILFILGSQLLDNIDGPMLLIGKRISYGEILFILYMFGALLKIMRENSISWLLLSHRQKKFICYLVCFAFWVGFSWAINTIFRDGDIMDFFGVPVRVLFYCFMSIFVARWVKIYGANIVVIPYCSGILTMFYYNFTTGFMDIGGVPVGVPNNTVSAVLLPVSSLFLALTGMVNPGVLCLLLMCISFMSTFLVYSLSGLVYMFLGLPAVLVSMHNFFSNKRVGIGKRFFMLVLLVLLATAVVDKFGFAFETIKFHVSRKLDNLPSLAESTDGSESGQQRWAIALSGLVITMKNPIFGVGEYNFRDENLKNQKWLGARFFDHKNPHNALVHILSMFGIPAFFLFAMCLYIAFKQLYDLRIKRWRKWKIFVLSSIFVFIATANVVDSIFTTTYFYFYAALIFGIEGWRHQWLRDSHEVSR